MAYHLVALDKSPGMRPVGIGEEVYRRLIVAKCILEVAGSQATAAAGNLNPSALDFPLASRERYMQRGRLRQRCPRQGEERRGLSSNGTPGGARTKTRQWTDHQDWMTQLPRMTPKVHSSLIP
jgi:hypothetical protein